jgi:hypothetical protein
MFFTEWTLQKTHVWQPIPKRGCMVHTTYETQLQQHPMFL